MDDLSCFFTKVGTFSNFLLKKSPNAPKHGSLFEKLQIFLQNRQIFVLFREMRHFLQLFAEKFTKTVRHGILLEKNGFLAKSPIFCAFLRNEALFGTFFQEARQNVETW